MPPRPRQPGWPDYLLDILGLMMIGGCLVAILLALPATLRIAHQDTKAAWNEALRFRARQPPATPQAGHRVQQPTDRARYIYRRSESAKGWQRLQPYDYPPADAPPLTGQELLDTVKAILSMSSSELDTLFAGPDGSSQEANGTRTIYIRPVRLPPPAYRGRQA